MTYRILEVCALVALGVACSASDTRTGAGGSNAGGGGSGGVASTSSGAGAGGAASSASGGGISGSGAGGVGGAAGVGGSNDGCPLQANPGGQCGSPGQTCTYGPVSCMCLEYVWSCTG